MVAFTSTPRGVHSCSLKALGWSDCRAWTPLAQRGLVRRQRAISHKSTRPRMSHIGADRSVNLPSNHGRKSDAYGPVILVCRVCGPKP